MKEVKVKCYDVNDREALANAVAECAKDKAYGLLKINGVKVALNPDYLDRISTEVYLEHLETMTNLKLYAEYAAAVLENDSATQKEIKGMFEGYEKSCPITNMSKSNITKTDIYNDNTLANMNALSKEKEKFLVQTIEEQLVICGPNIAFTDVLMTFDNNEMVKVLEDKIQKQMKPTESR